MKFTYNWLKDFAEIKIPPQDLADKLTMAGLEVVSLEEKDGDFVFEIEVTSNRPDWLNVIGIAREAAAITKSKLKADSVERRAYSKNLSAKRYPLNAKILKIHIENKKDCPLYTAKIIKDVKVGPSPDWLKKRLESVGCRSVNNIVDITNYVLFEYGEPLHAFDLDRLLNQSAGQPVSGLEINIRRAKKQEEIVTLDGVKRILDENILVIAAGVNQPASQPADKPVALAGIMGGKDTEVTEGTKNILLEAAVFDPVVIRRCRRALNLESESAYRFERGVDAKKVEGASQAAARLIQELAGAACVLAKSLGTAGKKRKRVSLSLETTRQVLGLDIGPARVNKILSSLGFKVNSARPGKSAKNKFLVDVPAARTDVSSEIDLIEEIARIYGFEAIPKTLPRLLCGAGVLLDKDALAQGPETNVYKKRALSAFVRNILAGLGLNEVITYSLIDQNLLESFSREKDSRPLEIINPLNKEQEILRPSLIPSLAVCVSRNLNQKQGYVSIFEIAGVFSGSAFSPQEELSLAVAICGTKSILLKEGVVEDRASMLHLKGILEALFRRLGIEDYDFGLPGSSSQAAVYAAQEKIGYLARLEQAAMDKLNIKNKEVFVSEVSLNKLFASARLKKNFTPFSRYPAITRDISFVLREEILAKDVLRAIQEKAKPLLRAVRIVDYYKGRQIPPGYKGLTVSCVYRCEERTLTEDEINPAHNLICNMLEESFAAKIRG